jgi:hypothetical protein
MEANIVWTMCDMHGLFHAILDNDVGQLAAKYPLRENVKSWKLI